MSKYDREPDVVLNVLGTNYAVYKGVARSDDKVLETCAGYCDRTAKRIVVAAVDAECECGEPDEYTRYILRHEIIHAFLYESGIGGDTVWDIEGQDHPEHMVEWIAMQFEKMMKAFKAVDAL